MHTLDANGRLKVLAAPNINGLTEDTAPANADYIAEYDASAAANRKVSRTNFLGYDVFKQNFLINGSFRFAQRQAPGTLTSYTTTANRTYAADRWGMSIQTSSLQFLRTDTNGSLETGITGRHYGSFKQITSAGKFLISQVVEADSGFPLASRTVTFQVRMKASGSKTIRIGIAELNSSGTVDSPPATFISAWNSNSTDPTLGTNVAYITTAAAVPASAQGTVSGNGVSCSVTTAWQLFAISVTAPSNAKNLIPIIWTDSQFSANDILSVAEAGLYDGGAVRHWLPRLLSQEFLLAKRFYHKSYAIDTAPATVTDTSCVAYAVGGAGGEYAPYIVYPSEMRTTPTKTYYSTATGTSGKRRNASDATDENMTGVNIEGPASHAGTTTGHTDGKVYRYHFTANAEI